MRLGVGDGWVRTYFSLDTTVKAGCFVRALDSHWARLNHFFKLDFLKLLGDTAQKFAVLSSVESKMLHRQHTFMQYQRSNNHLS